MADNVFYTFNEYMKCDDNKLTASMEDYLEMIYRIYEVNGYVRINELAQSLNVKPSSATKMVQKLRDLNLINYERYGAITLSIEGDEIGKKLLNRHKTIEYFLKLLGVKENYILEETEKIEHTINKETLCCIEDFIEYVKNDNNFMEGYNKFRMNK
ncbi:transcriptional regulator MntR [Clostridium hydrogeniformans]|uniref:transcriptional regulator MntR n=1 Tax=Clostridium hydrogeniformans TaxID=349933 RepID=UPI000483A13D|nr:transcriptional regulator MntR [Clostridium hydrogeniformans]